MRDNLDDEKNRPVKKEGNKRKREKPAQLKITAKKEYKKRKEEKPDSVSENEKEQLRKYEKILGDDEK